MNVFDEIDASLLAALARMLELDPALSKREALERLERVATEGGLVDSRKRLDTFAGRLTRHGVLNPCWLEQEGLRPYFFLANSMPGFLNRVVQQSEETRPGISHYVLYGDWDALVVLHGTEREAGELHDNLRMGAYTEPTQFTTERVLLTDRHPVVALDDDRATPTTSSTPIRATEQVNALVRDFDAPHASELHDRLVSGGHLLGSVWKVDGRQPYPVEAFVGLALQGRSFVPPDQVLASLLRHDVLRETLVHAYQIRHGQPFHYFLKLGCMTMRELDDATNAIGDSSSGSVRFEGVTYVVASGTEQLPMFRQADVSGLPLAPDVTPMVRATERVFARLSVDEQRAFNRLEADQKIAVVKSLGEIGDRVENATLSATTKERLSSALSTFSRECVVNAGRPNLTGAVTEVTTTVEGDLKRLLSRLAYGVYGKDPARIQTELKLPTRAIRNLSLGKAIHALRTAREHPDFGHWADLLTDSWLERIDRFAEQRNQWAHDAVPDDLDAAHVLDEAHRTITEAVEVSDWIEACLADINRSSQRSADPVDLDVASFPQTRDFGVFVSHASADRKVAERIATGLKVFGLRAWYSEWELQPGDSIVTRIETGLAQSDTVLVLLSKPSVTSRWVQRELNAALMAQLSGHDIQVVPVIIEDCDIPELLRDTFHVDLRTDFEDGLLTLLKALRNRRRRESD